MVPPPCSYPAGVGEPHHEFEPEPWGEDAELVDVFGEQGAAELRALLDGFPELVGILWAVRDADDRIVDFAFGYGNPTMVRRFRLTAQTPDRYTLLGALPPMRGSSAFESYVRVCETGQPWVTEVTYDTPFGDGYMLGTFLHRAAKLGDGLIVFLHDVTDGGGWRPSSRGTPTSSRTISSEPLAGIELLVSLLERRPEEPPSAEVLAGAPRPASDARAS